MNKRIENFLWICIGFYIITGTSLMLFIGIGGMLGMWN